MLCIIGLYPDIKTSQLLIPQLINHLLSIAGIWVAVWFVIRNKFSDRLKFREQEKLDALFENATEGFLITDTKGQVVLSNPSATKQFGFTKEELIGKPVEELMPKRFKSGHSHYRNSYYVNPHSRSMGSGVELFGMRKDGTEFPIEISLSSFITEEGMFVIAFIIDITERKKDEGAIAHHVEEIQNLNAHLEQLVEKRTTELAQAIIKLERTNKNLQENISEKQHAEQALKESQRIYSAIAHNFPNGIIALLDSNLNVIFIDGNELVKLNLNPSELLNRNLTSKIPINNPDFISEKLNRVLDKKQQSFEISIVEESYFVNAVPLIDLYGDVNQLLMVWLNITERKRAEEEIKNALEKEKQLNELKSRFVNMASHEFRTPLSSILSSVTLIEKYPAEAQQEKRLKHVDRIKGAVKNMNEILNDFLSLGKLEEGKIQCKPDWVELNFIIDDVLETMNGMLKQGQRININLPELSENIFTDKNLLRNILVNLLSNAIKYSPEESVIDLKILIIKSEMIIEVTDQGIGIPKEDQVHLFERFFRANNSTNIQGTGLGLNIIKRYLELLGGTITFKSEINKGSSFFIQLPKNQN
ncbi:hypothetical protein LBMAG27_22800 [Bacteroidota bacterium]|nr:hypothetical protein LBMAG27_22800 [Bacteroidota bacterium]